MRMFRNDYSEGAAPAILDALVRTNYEQHPGYTEGDAHCERARQLIRDFVGRQDVDVEFAIGGTSANIVGVTGMLHDWEGVICTKDGHINVHETGSIAACGRTVLPTQDADGFLSPAEAEKVWQFQTSTGRHMTRPAMIYITDTTEIGGVWSRERFDAICDWAESHDLKIFVDGARMASAMTSPENDLPIQHIARRASAFYLDSTKNGMLTETSFKYQTTNMYDNEVRSFLENAPKGIKTKASIDCALVTSQVMDMMYKSSELGEEVKA